MADVDDEMVEAAVVAAEEPSFRRLNAALRRRGFQVAAYVTEHQMHILGDEIHSDCEGCMALFPTDPVTGKAMTFHYEDERLPDGRTLRRPVLDDAGK